MSVICVQLKNILFFNLYGKFYRICSFTIFTIGKIGYNYTQDLITRLNNIKNINSSIFSIKI